MMTSIQTGQILQALIGGVMITSADARAMADALPVALTTDPTQHVTDAFSQLVQAGVIAIQEDANAATDWSVSVIRSNAQSSTEQDLILQALESFCQHTAQDRVVQTQLRAAAYLAAVRSYCAGLPCFTPFESPDVEYIPMKVEPWPHQEEHDLIALRHYTGLRDLPDLEFCEPLSIAEMMQTCQQQHVMIIGGPGAGKSTLLRQLAVCAWDDPSRIGLDLQHLPILLPLRRLVTLKDGVPLKSDENRLKRVLSDELGLKQTLPEGFFTDWPKYVGAPWLLLLDGWNEASAGDRDYLQQWIEGMFNSIEAGSSSDKQRETFDYKWLLGIPKGIGKDGGLRHRLVVSSRPLGEAIKLGAMRFGRYDLLPLTPGQSGQLAHAWLGERAGRFLQEVGHVRAGAARGTPLLLVIAAIVYQERGTLPERRSGLYRQFLDISPAHDLINPTFREYMTAWTAVQAAGRDPARVLWQAVISRWGDDDWREAALFALGILSDDEQDVTALVERVWQEDREAGFDLAVAALDEGCRVKPALGDRIARGLLTWACAESLDTRMRVHAAETLGQWGRAGEAAQAWSALAGHALVGVRVRAAKALEQLGRVEEAARAWLALANYKGVRVQVRAAEALGQLGWADEAAQAWLALASDAGVDEGVRRQTTETLDRLGRIDEAAQAWSALARDIRVNEHLRKRAAENLGALGRVDEAAHAWLAIARDERVSESLRWDAAQMLAQLGRAGDLLAVARDAQVSERMRLEAAEALNKLGRVDETAQAWLAIALTRAMWADILHEKAVQVLLRLGRAGELLTLARDVKTTGRLAEEIVGALAELREADNLLTLSRDAQASGWSREQAVQALARLGRVDMLLSLAHDEHAREPERMQAAKSLARLGQTDDLLALARDEQMSKPGRVKAAHVLGQLGRIEEAKPMLLALARDEQAYAPQRVRAAEALLQLGQAEEAVPVLLAMANDAQLRSAARVQAGEVLIRAGHEEDALSALLALARDVHLSEDSRRRTTEVLGKLKRSEQVMEAWRALASDVRVDEGVRSSAVEALGRWCDLKHSFAARAMVCFHFGTAKLCFHSGP